MVHLALTYSQSIPMYAILPLRLQKQQTEKVCVQGNSSSQLPATPTHSYTVNDTPRVADVLHGPSSLLHFMYLAYGTLMVCVCLSPGTTAAVPSVQPFHGGYEAQMHARPRFVHTLLLNMQYRVH